MDKLTIFLTNGNEDTYETNHWVFENGWLLLDLKEAKVVIPSNAISAVIVKETDDIGTL